MLGIGWPATIGSQVTSQTPPGQWLQSSVQSGLHATNAPPAEPPGRALQGAPPTSPTTILFKEDGAGEDLLVRSLRATLGIAEQFGVKGARVSNIISAIESG